MSGVLGNYPNLVKEAQKKRLEITHQQSREIAQLYKDCANDLEREISKHSEKSLSSRWLKDYSRVLRENSKELYQKIENIVTQSIMRTAAAVTEAERAFYSGAAPFLSERFTDVFSTIPQQMVDELMSGGIYKNFAGLSERLWNYQGQYSHDIGYIINRGIIAQKSAYDLAKDLEIYLRPSERKPWEWINVYPNAGRLQVDYNAQRLARTSVTHAYQLSFQRATIDNPFVDKYQWLSSGSPRMCSLCAERDGQLFDKDALPLDHPNGMCTVIAIITKSYDEIAKELGDWAAGEENPALDRWLSPENNMTKSLESGIINTKNIRDLSLRAIQNQQWFSDILQTDQRSILEKFEQATDGELRFWKKYGGKVQGNFYDRHTAGFYSQLERKVHLQLDNIKDARVQRIKDSSDCRVFFHETGHLFDHQVLDGKFISSHLSELRKHIEKDALNHANRLFTNAGVASIRSFSRLTSEQKKILCVDLYEDIHLKNAVSDIYDGLTNHRVTGGYGHQSPPNYWKRPGALERETVAHLFEAKMMKGERLDILKRYFPQTWDYFEAFIHTLEV